MENWEWKQNIMLESSDCAIQKDKGTLILLPSAGCGIIGDL